MAKIRLQCFTILGAILASHLMVPQSAHAKDYQSITVVGPPQDLQVEGMARTLRAKAESGSSDSQYALAAMLLNGDGIDKDAREALAWFEKAGSQGHAEAQYIAGFMYDHGLGCERDDEKSLEWTRRAAESGERRAMYSLGQRYRKGLAVPIDFAKAQSWISRAAQYEYPPAQLTLGYLKHLGIGCEKDYEHSIKWFVRAAEQGETVAQANLGEAFMKGDGVRKDLVEALKWYSIAAGKKFQEADDYARLLRLELTREQISAAEQRQKAWLAKFPIEYPSPKQTENRERMEAIAASGNVAMMIWVGTMYEIGAGVPADLEVARSWMRRAAETGDPMGLVGLAGFDLAHDAGSSKGKEAVGLLLRAAKLDPQLAATQLGKLYEEGKVVPRDLKEALHWFETGAQHGDVDAMFRGAELRLNGKDVEHNYTQAHDWYLKATEGWHTVALLRLGTLYEKGIGVKKDLVEAMKWYSLAERQGMPEAKINVSKLRSRLSPAELSRAAKAVGKWIEAHPVKVNMLKPQEESNK